MKNSPPSSPTSPPRHAVSYILDTFPIVKRKDLAAHSTYRTKDRIPELYDQMLQARQADKEWKRPLNPPPGPPTDKDGNFLPFEFWKQNIPSHIHPPRNE